MFPYGVRPSSWIWILLFWTTQEVNYAVRLPRQNLVSIRYSPPEILRFYNFATLAENSPTNGPIWIKLGWSHPIMSPICPPCCGCLAMAHWTFCRASGGQTREPILIKFGTQQHVRTRMTVTWLNIKIFKTQNGGRPPCWKIFEMS